VYYLDIDIPADYPGIHFNCADLVARFCKHNGAIDVLGLWNPGLENKAIEQA
jgi:hypothetical protein